MSTNLGGVQPGCLGEGPADLLVVKPPGMTVFPSRQRPGQGDLLGWILDRWPTQGSVAWPEGFDGGILHRLDTATSGLVWVARDLEGLARRRALFSAGVLEKRYVFLTTGEASEGIRAGWEVRWEIGHHPEDRRRMIVRRGARTGVRGKWYPARTRLRRVWEGGALGSVWEAVITTGVMHQIRVHAKAVGLSLLGDTLYGGADGTGPAPDAPFWLHHLDIQWSGGKTPTAPLPSVWRQRLPAEALEALTSAGIPIGVQLRQQPDDRVQDPVDTLVEAPALQDLLAGGPPLEDHR